MQAEALPALERAGLIRQTPGALGSKYTIHHALIKQVAYKSLLREERRQLHQTVGQVLERMHAGRPEDAAAQIADHFTQAEDWPRAFQYHRMAADEALKVYAHEEALSHYDQALEAGERAGMEDEHWEIYLRRGRAFELSGQHEKALANYQEMEQRAKEAQKPNQQLRAQLQSAVLYCTPSPVVDPRKGLQIAKQTLKRGRELENVEAQARSLWLHLLVKQFSMDQQDAAVEAGEKALALTRGQDLPMLRGYILNDLGSTYGMMGHVERADEVLTEARQLMVELDNMPMLSNVLVNQMQQSMIAGDYERAFELSEEGYEISESIGNLWGQACSLMYIDLVHAELGDYRRALETGAQCIRMGDASGFVIPAVVSNSTQAWIKSQLGLSDEAKRHVEMDTIQTTGLIGTIAGQPLSARALVCLEAGDISSAQDAVTAAVDTLPTEPDSELHPVLLFTRLAQAKLSLAQEEYEKADRISARIIETMKQRGFHLLRTEFLLLRARAQRAVGELEGAMGCLEEGIDEAEQADALRPLWQLLDEQAALHTERGNEEKAAERRRRARSIVQQLIKNISPIGLDRSFSERPQVRALLDSSS